MQYHVPVLHKTINYDEHYFDKTFVNDYNEYPKDKKEFEDNKKNKGEQYFRKVLTSLLSEIDTIVSLLLLYG